MPAYVTVPISDTCLVCDGTGRIVFPISLGVVDLVPCRDCNGSGVRERKKSKS